ATPPITACFPRIGISRSAASMPFCNGMTPVSAPISGLTYWPALSTSHSLTQNSTMSTAPTSAGLSVAFVGTTWVSPRPPGVLGLGFLLGMQHALEADHIAAVSSIAARRSEVGDIVRHGLTWGLGHTLTLFAFAGAAILLGHAIPEELARPIESAVGIMLIGLGAHVLWRLWRDRVHFHLHAHGDGTRHIHVHSHANETVPHRHSAHAHEHGFRWRSLL